MVYDHQSTVRSRYVGQALARASQQAGQNGSDMAAMLRWSPSKVSRLLSGKRAASTEDVAAFLALCRVTGPVRDELLAHTALGYDQTWCHDHGTRPPAHLPALADSEADATRITCFATTLIPDLLRVPDYTRAVLATHPTIPDDEIEERVTATAQRQHILDRTYSPPSMRIYLTDHTLTHPGAADTVMSDQAHHLLRLAVRPDITIRIVPDTHQTIGLHECGPFTLLEFDQHQPAVYLEHATTTAFLEQPTTITTYRTIITELNQLALTRDDSRDRITDIARQRTNTHPAHAADALPIWATG